MIAQGGKKPVFVPLTETNDDWILDPEKIEKAVTKKTKAILFCNPCNPTGKVYSKKELKHIARIAKKHNLFIISDEMYEYFIFDNKKHISIGSFKEVRNLSISVFGLSKSYAMTGWRIGYIVAHKKVIEQVFKIHDSLVTCPTVVSQYAALAALLGDQQIVETYRNEYLKRRQIAVDELSKTKKLHTILPQGGYYIFPKILKKVDDEKLAIDLIKKAKVATIPGSSFGKGGENHMRIAFGVEEKTLKEGLRRFVNYIEKNL